MGGSNKSDNLVLLTVAEHLMAHTLLFRENPNNRKMANALYHMSNEIGIEKLLETVDNKEEFEELVSDIVKAKSMYDVKGENNPMFNKHHTEESRQLMSEKTKGRYAGEKNPLWGKHHTPEARKKMSIAKSGKNAPRAKKVYCPELDMTFDTIKEAQQYIGVTSGILQCCKFQFNRKTAGRHPVTNEKLHWRYV